jgi:hypothetical protein
MARFVRSVGWHVLGAALGLGLFPALVAAGEPFIKGARKFDPQRPTVELFAGLDARQLEARLIAKDSTTCRLFVTNKTDRAVNVAVPAALAAVPVLAQLDFPLDAGPDNSQAASGPSQRLGMGVPGDNPGGGPGNRPLFDLPDAVQGVMPPGQGAAVFFNLAPEQTAQLRLPSVCLEYGKPDPRPQLAYEVRPIAEVAAEPELHEICRMLGRGEIAQKAAQAAAWHLHGGMDWDAVEAIRYTLAMGRLKVPYFTRRELAQAKEAVERAGFTAGSPVASTADAQWVERR